MLLFPPFWPLWVTVAPWRSQCTVFSLMKFAIYRSRFSTIACANIMWRLALYAVIINSYVKLTVLKFCLTCSLPVPITLFDYCALREKWTWDRSHASPVTPQQIELLTRAQCSIKLTTMSRYDYAHEHHHHETTSEADLNSHRCSLIFLTRIPITLILL